MASESDQFPPAPFDLAAARYSEHDAWWAGDMEFLQKLYAGVGTATHTVKGRAYKGGVLGNLAKMWVGQPVVEGEDRARMHVGVPAVLARLSATLLVGEGVKIAYGKPDDVVVDKDKPWVHPGQARLDVIMQSDETKAELLKSTEQAAALGGGFLAVTWNARLRSHVRIRSYAADCAIPEFQDGILTSVTLWTEHVHGNDVFRLLERHDRGFISFTLHKGGTKTLGPVVPLGSLAETAHYNGLRTQGELDMAIEDPTSWDETVIVATGVDELAVVYYPNLPQIEWRRMGVLANLGRSDFAGKEPLFDKIDKWWSSLDIDFDLGKGRITAPEAYLENMGRGKGGKLDIERTVYSGLEALGKSSDSLSSQLTISQFDIRYEEHLAAIAAIKHEIANECGISPAHLGLKAEQGAKTATEVTADYTESEATRDQKALYLKPALARLAQVALAIDGTVFPAEGGKFYDELPDVTFAPVSQMDPEKIARIVGLLDVAGAASTRQKVMDVRPDWDEGKVDEEVKLIQEERGMGPEADPTLITGPLDEANPAAPDVTD
ncbi:phage portal protein [Cryobacterium arcticum]|uniref:Uncharacterized protein n=1 Tax=Cryobacterium arcticum TaxID=670052 RepID=A0A1B1BPN4_9MICO|nr:phage portal protein [Cryobacterium arcticum]ANP74527.1 hypothetical protein PA27867_3608 [Cryobacterium arcticum]